MTDLTDEQLNAILGPSTGTASVAVAESAAGPTDQYGNQLTDSSGMPISDSSAPEPSNLSMSDPDNTPQPSGFLGSIESFGTAAVSAAKSAVTTGYGAVKTVGSDVVTGVGKAESSVLSPITTNVFILLAVVGVVLVLVFKTGNVKANIIA